MAVEETPVPGGNRLIDSHREFGEASQSLDSRRTRGGSQGSRDVLLAPLFGLRQATKAAAP